jgi:hypothetical protein
MPEKSEVMVYVPASFMARFVATGQTHAALTTLYGDRAWEDIARDATSREEAGEKLAGLFYDQLNELFEWVTSFQVDPERHNDYYLLFGTGHRKGLRAMKQGMWRVDQTGGQAYKQAKTYGPGQGQLFADSALVEALDLSPLARLLRARFGYDVFTIEDAEEYTLCRTKYLDSPHLRDVLRLLEKAGDLQAVNPPPTRRRGTYPDGTKLRFVS